MTIQKIVITKDQGTINDMIDKGWYVSSVTAQYVSTGSSSTALGEFCFVMEKNHHN